MSLYANTESDMDKVRDQREAARNGNANDIAKSIDRDVPLDAEAIRRDQAAHHNSRSQPVYRQNITGCDDIVIRHGLVKEYVWKLCRERRQAAKHPAERPEDETIPKRRRRE